MTYRDWLAERFRRGQGFAEENARWRRERLAANNGQEPPRVSLPHYLAARWQGQPAPAQNPVAAQKRNQAPRVQGGGLKSYFTQPPLPPAPKPPAVPEFALDEARNKELRIREITGIVTNEMRDITPGPSTAADLERAKRAKVDAIINADEKYGVKRQQIAGTAPTTVSFDLSKSPQYQDNLRITREQVLGRKLGSAKDTAQGRTFIGNSSNVIRSRPIGRSRQTVHQQFGPFRVGRRTVYDYTYNDPPPRTGRR